MYTWKSWGAWAAVVMPMALGAAGCGNGTTLPKNQAVQQKVSLSTFEDCGSLERYIEDQAVLEMKAHIEASKESLRRSASWFGGGGGVPMGQEDAGAPPASPSPSPSNYTTTNTQVKGVDEADFVKNDGTRIFVLSGRTLYANQSWPANELKTVGTLELEGWPQEMFLDGDRIVVISNVYLRAPSTAGSGGPTTGLAADSPCAPGGMYCGWGPSHTKLTVVDVSNLAAPRVTREEYVPGQYSTSRRIGSSVRIVLSDSVRTPDGVRYWPEYREDLWRDSNQMIAELDALIGANERLIREATLSDWLPSGMRRTEGGALVDVGYRCEDVHRPNAATRLGVLTVATLNLDSAADVSRTTVLSQPGVTYASADNLYVASWHWWWWPEEGQVDHSYVHKFSLTDPDKATYLASGTLEGHVVDQFSMDEHEGFLRVATNIARRGARDPNGWWRTEVTNRVSVLGELEGRLLSVGRTPELAPGEQIFSSRFIGKRGFVVTFERIDPLFTLDLADPADPKIIGELKIPGFSTYLHPLDENHLLTIGTYVPENEPNNWNARTLQLSIFDVSDFANPVQKFTHKVGTAYSWSEAMWNHKAFNYFAAKKLLAIPFSSWDSGYSGDQYWSSFTSDLRVFEVDVNTGFLPKGALSMRDVYQTHQRYDWTWYWAPSVRRSVMADDFVYAISDAGVRVANVADLTSPLATVLFDRAEQ